MHVGLVTEGKSEWFVLEALIRRIDPKARFTRFRPDLTLLSGAPHGWRGVKHWCEENRSDLHALLRGVKGDEIDLLVVHVDCSMAQNVGARRPCPPPEATADELRRVVLDVWLAGAAGSFPTVVVAAAQTIDTWVVAALEPPFAPAGHVECATDAEDELVRRRLLRRKDGEVKKPESRFKPLAEQVSVRFEVVMAACAQAQRFHDECAGAFALVA